MTSERPIRAAAISGSVRAVRAAAVAAAGAATVTGAAVTPLGLQ